MKIKSRTVHFFDLELHTLSLDENISIPPQLPLDALLPHLVPFIRVGSEIKCGKTPIEVTQMRWSAADRELVLLLSKPDPERSDVAYRKRTTKARRLGNKAVDEDIDVSSHVVIKLPRGSSVARMLLTTGAGIAPAKIISLLGNAYKAAKESISVKRLRHIPLPTGVLASTGKVATYLVNHRFAFNAMPNGMLVDIIRTGKIVGLNLINTGPHAFDSSTRVKIDRMLMHIDLKSESVDIPYIKKLLNIASKKRDFDSDQIRVEYTDQTGEDAVVKNKTFETSRLEEAFTRSETIELDHAHTDHQTEISDEIVRKMLELI